MFGQPIRIGKYDANDLKTKDQLTAALFEAGSSLALIIPKQAEFELLDGKSSNANGDLQNKMKDACNNELDVLILGNTETTGNSNGGSNAKAKEQGKQQDEIIKADMGFLLGELNSAKCKSILASYGYPVADGNFAFKKEVDLAELKERMQIDTTIAQQVPVGDDYFYETYGIPKPANYDQLKKEKQDQQITSVATEKKQSDSTKKTKPNNLSAMDRIRAVVADFFDPARKD